MLSQATLGASWADLGLENAPASVLEAIPGEAPTPNYTICCVLGSFFISLELCFAQKADFAWRLFAMHFLKVFRIDFGGSAPVTMWFWYRMCYENVFLQIAILAIEGSIFNLFAGAKPCQNAKMSFTYELQQVQEEVRNHFNFLFLVWNNWVPASPAVWSLKTFRS